MLVHRNMRAALGGCLEQEKTGGQKLRPRVLLTLPPVSLLENRPSNQRQITRKARRKMKKSKDAKAVEKKQDPGSVPSPVHKKRARFSQLGDLASLDLIYKKALHTAHISNGVCLAQPNNAAPGSTSGGNTGSSPYDLWSQQHQCGNGPTWAQTGFASKRVWGIGRRLMGLLATGMVSNLLKRMSGRVDIRYMYSKVSFMGAIFWVQGFAARSKCIAVVMSLSKIHPIRNRSRQRGLHGPGTRTAIHLPIGPCFGHGDSLAKVLAHLYLVRPSLGRCRFPYIISVGDFEDIDCCCQHALWYIDIAASPPRDTSGRSTIDYCL